jgi:hypothetical protein
MTPGERRQREPGRRHWVGYHAHADTDNPGVGLPPGRLQSVRGALFVEVILRHSGRKVNRARLGGTDHRPSHLRGVGAIVAGVNRFGTPSLYRW